MPTPHYRFSAELWEYEGTASWHFVSLPEPIADEIEERYAATAGGFGSVRVEVTVGTTRWSTSLFPDKKRGTYILPVKKPVRLAEDLTPGDPVTVALTIL
ncbi:DUF1905 domain-containing protein [Nocardia sp. NPDC050406]|uniref:DUF1905 domain-containing protein n=1 Tax=Nocardia sp. NPDC050406 TaxID=3364318 RepID=UPI0037A222F2